MIAGAVLFGTGTGTARALVVCSTPDGSVYAGDAPPKDCAPKRLDDDATAHKRPRYSHQAAYGLWECDSGYVISTTSGGNSCIPAEEVPKGPTMEISPPSSWCVSCGTTKKHDTTDGSSTLKRCAEEFPEDFKKQLSCLRDGSGGAEEASAPGRAIRKCSSESPADPDEQARCLIRQLGTSRDR